MLRKHCTVYSDYLTENALIRSFLFNFDLLKILKILFLRKEGVPKCLFSLDPGIRTLNEEFPSQILRALAHIFPNLSIKYKSFLLNVLENLIRGVPLEGIRAPTEHIVEKDPH